MFTNRLLIRSGQSPHEVMGSAFLSFLSCFVFFRTTSEGEAKCNGTLNDTLIVSLPQTEKTLSKGLKVVVRRRAGSHVLKF